MAAAGNVRWTMFGFLSDNSVAYMRNALDIVATQGIQSRWFSGCEDLWRVPYPNAVDEPGKTTMTSTPDLMIDNGRRSVQAQMTRVRSVWHANIW